MLPLLSSPHKTRFLHKCPPPKPISTPTHYRTSNPAATNQNLAYPALLIVAQVVPAYYSTPIRLTLTKIATACKSCYNGHTKESDACTAVHAFFRDCRSRGFWTCCSSCLPVLATGRQPHGVMAQFRTASPAGTIVTLEGGC